MGALAGWFLTRRLGTSDSTANQEDRLERNDLIGLRDELYARLRPSDLRSEERTRLELRAARVLKRLDELGGEPASESLHPAPPAPATRAHDATQGPSQSPARHAIGGFVLGGGLVGLIAVLIFWAGRDARPRPEDSGMQGVQVAPEAPHPDLALQPEVGAEVERLRTLLEQTPGDVDSRKRLAFLYLASDQFVPAFQEAELILNVSPDDIDALYVMGVVRMTMGQDALAVEKLDRVLLLFPDHVRAMTVKGLILARNERGDEARRIWQQALEVGGPRAEIQNLLAILDQEESGRLAGAGSAPAAGSEASPEGFAIRVLADGPTPAGGVVFVALRAEGGGPPIAVRRIERPRFPLELVLSQSDSMMGALLPESGTLSVRLDGDGSASTREPGDLEARAGVRKGEATQLILKPGRIEPGS